MPSNNFWFYGWFRDRGEAFGAGDLRIGRRRNRNLCLSDNVPLSGIWSWANEVSEPFPAEHVRGRRKDDEAAEYRKCRPAIFREVKA